MLNRIIQHINTECHRLTNWYKYQRYIVIHHTHPDDGDQHFRNVSFHLTLIRLIAGENVYISISRESSNLI
jgi:hypothetical protein